ncbi:nucleolar transcription factor 1 [Trichonephila clavipes]|nr:nucleolar transcription factor 1 [Trichonephila clavipes]
MASTETSGRRKASKRPFPAAASDPSANGPVQATDLSPVAAKKSKPTDPAPSKSKGRKENDDLYPGKCTVVVPRWRPRGSDELKTKRLAAMALVVAVTLPGGCRAAVTGDEAHFWFNGYVNKQNCLIWSEANPQVYVETPLHPEKLTVWCALWAGGILLQKR